MRNVPLYKVVATAGGVFLTGAAVWMNVDHVMHAEGSFSPLVLASVIVTICAASAPPFAERAWQSGEYAKSLMIWLFFVVTVAFSLFTSISRSSDYAGGKVASVESGNKAAKLAEEAYEAAKKAAEEECTKRGPNCRKAEDKRDKAREKLTEAAPARVIDAGADRVAAVLGIDRASVQLYSPLLLPLSLEFGGFIFLAFGLAPKRRRKEVASPAGEPQAVTNPMQAAATPAIEMQADASPTQGDASASIALAEAPAAGTKAYFLQRLAVEHPQIAEDLAQRKIKPANQAFVLAGYRKPQSDKWTKIDAYAAKATTE